MTLSRKIAAALDAHTPSGTAPSEVHAEAGPHRLTLRLNAAGPVGLAFDQLEFATLDRTDWSADQLRAWADRLVGRVTYLMEPLIVLEVDPIAGEVELRSQAPTVRDGRRAFYEVRLNRQGVLRLTRLAFDEAARSHRPTPCQITREALERLADDLAASVG